MENMAPKGVVMILIDDAGREIATVHDFNSAGYGGFTLERAQEIRCRDQLARRAAKNLASPALADNLDSYHLSSWMDTMTCDKGWRIHTISTHDRPVQSAHREVA